MTICFHASSVDGDEHQTCGCQGDDGDDAPRNRVPGLLRYETEEDSVRSTPAYQSEAGEAGGARRRLKVCGHDAEVEESRPPPTGALLSWR